MFTIKTQIQTALILVSFSVLVKAFENDMFNNNNIDGMMMNSGYHNNNYNYNNNNMNPLYNNNNNNNNNMNYNSDELGKTTTTNDNGNINVNSIRPAPIPVIHKNPLEQKCQSERFEHPVKSATYSDLTGKWVIYTQIIETKNIANHCHRNEYIYLAHRQKSGWFWNPTITSLIHYSLGEPKFLTRRIRDPNIDLDRAFPYRMATQIASMGTDDIKWNNLAKTSLPILHQDTAYFQIVLPRENSGSSHLKVLSNTRLNHEILE